MQKNSTEPCTNSLTKSDRTRTSFSSGSIDWSVVIKLPVVRFCAPRRSEQLGNLPSLRARYLPSRSSHSCCCRRNVPDPSKRYAIRRRGRGLGKAKCRHCYCCGRSREYSIAGQTLRRKFLRFPGCHWRGFDSRSRRTDHCRVARLRELDDESCCRPGELGTHYPQRLPQELLALSRHESFRLRHLRRLAHKMHLWRCAAVIG